MEVVDRRTLIEIGNNSFITENDIINISELIQFERREPNETVGVSSIELGLDKKMLHIYPYSKNWKIPKIKGWLDSIEDVFVCVMNDKQKNIKWSELLNVPKNVSIAVLEDDNGSHDPHNLRQGSGSLDPFE